MSRLLLILMAVALSAAEEMANKTENQLTRNSRGVLDHASRLSGMMDAAMNAATSLTGLVGGSKSSSVISPDTYELVEVPQYSSANRVGQLNGQGSGSVAGSYQPCWPEHNDNQGPTVTRRVVGQNRRQLGDGPIRHPPVTVSRTPSSGSAMAGGSSIKQQRGSSAQSAPTVTVKRLPPVTIQGAPSMTAQNVPSMTAQNAPSMTACNSLSMTAQNALSMIGQKAPTDQPSEQSSWRFAPSSLLSLAMPFRKWNPPPPPPTPIAPIPPRPSTNCHTVCLPPCPPQRPCPPPPPPQVVHIEHPPQVIETVVEHHIEHPPQVIEKVVEHHIEHPPEVIETVVEHHIEHPPTIIEHTQHVVEKVPQVVVAKPIRPPKSKGKFF